MKSPVAFFISLCVGLSWQSFSTLAQNNLPTTEDSLSDVRVLLKQAFPLLDSQKIGNTIALGKRIRGMACGSPSEDQSYSKPDTSPIARSSVENLWSLCLDPIVTWEPGCAELPGEGGSRLLALHIAGPSTLAQVPKGLAKDMANHLLATQWKTAFPSGPGAAGSFGMPYYEEADPCAPHSPAQRQISTFCKRYPEACPVFPSGPFAGQKFLVADQFPGVQEWDSPLSTQCAWATEMLLETFALTRDSVYMKSAEWAGSWLLEEKPVSQLTYTCRMVWGLAALYDATGKPVFRNKMLEWIRKLILPSMVRDQNLDGFEDDAGYDLFSLPFPMLRVGRFWDASPASSWNSAWGAIALTNAYAALRDRGDVQAAGMLKPAVDQMLSSLAYELVFQGYPPPGLGFRDLGFALLEGSWKIERAENRKISFLDDALKVIWNSGVLRTGQEQTVVVAQFMRWMENRPYTSRRQRIGLN